MASSYPCRWPCVTVRDVRIFEDMKTQRPIFSCLIGCLWLLALPACQADQPRLARLEAVQQQQAHELARLRQQLAAKEEEVAQLETCVDDLESTVYEDEDSTAYDDEPDRPTLRRPTHLDVLRVN